MSAFASAASRPRRRLAAALGMLLFALLAAGCADSTDAIDGGPVWRTGEGGGSTGAAAPGAERSGQPVESRKTVSLAATGDVIMGNAPSRLPANGGKGFFDDVEAALKADLVMGNLEEPLTEDTGTGKCGPDATDCYQFRAPPGYAAHLRDAGFQLLNQANNHGYDYGRQGYENTRAALEAHGLEHTGARGEITVVEVEGVKIAVLGFSPYAWSNSLTDIAAAKKVVALATEQADLVVVQAHMGAEGADKTRVKPGTELFYGENRGDPVRFSHAVIDAGADVVIGHGPHVLRGMEFYQGRLIAYSLGNFAGGGGSLNSSGRLGWGGVLKVSLTADGSFVEGEFISTAMNGVGRPAIDRQHRGLGLVREVSRADFPKTGARLDADGRITAPAGG
ncbi:Poly-gamma-glutamate biosynthesis protein CapA/YwtB (capsule formation), metallophosphatase superfamily [Micromonospora viridifaciens]|uniref:Poly-gamma-glutamate biosynthesis protein CapA/YwtB (Capsule formation), metallophosphatase superfamily n=1 Tax=Micromonospora viridifaciens TaxID=1881 RepID=A0A1C4UN68_MICVI|nr:CapA family protein [Micromonospora viridifaciens]SCE73115.1 Poly-gamma-glutamate biosynthesis protein CapA/YwtB (capsule formation), metallophosphatase superfamily [Micromonospora viridifaciens]